MRSKTLFLLLSIVWIFSGNAQNLNFEQSLPGAYTTSNAVTGWTVESTSTSTSMNCPAPTGSWLSGSPEFSVVATPVFASQWVSGAFSINNVTIPHSPFGGANIVRLNDSNPGTLATRLKTTFTVNTGNSSLYYAFAGSWDGSVHQCCYQPAFRFKLYDCAGFVVPGLSSIVLGTGPGCGGPNSLSVTGTPQVSWTNWTVQQVDLSQFIGSCVTIEIINNDCTDSNHHGTLYFDAITIPNYMGSAWFNINPLNPSQPVNYCPGSTIATMFAPPGNAFYQWYAPGSPPAAITASLGGNSASLTINNPLVGAVYTVQVYAANGYSFSLQDTIKASSISITGVGTTSTSCGGATGSASVVANGSGSGYTYSWLAPGNITAGTGPVISNLAQGIYTVTINALNSVACGSAVTSVTIGNSPYSTIIKPYCGNAAYLSAAPSASNIQWYNGLSAVPALLGGTAPNYTVLSPYNNQTIWLGQNTNSGCRDSLRIILSPTNTFGSLSLSLNKIICTGATNGEITLSLTPAPGSASVSNFFSIITSSSSAVFSVSPLSIQQTTFSANNLSAGAIYSVIASDGLCKYTTTLTPPVLAPFYFNASPPSGTVCQGNSISASVVFLGTVNPSAYTFSWTPNIFISANSNSLQTAIITPSNPINTINTSIYTVVVTPTLANCPQSQTLAITSVNLPTPTINPVPMLCNNAAYTIGVNPPGGVFIGNNTGISNSGVITASLTGTGIKSFTYSLLPGTCASKVMGSFTVNPPPTINITGGPLVCSGTTTTLTAMGAATYSWSTGVTGATLLAAPLSSTVLSVTGANSTANCSTTKMLTLTVVPSPTLVINGNTQLCENEVGILNASGANAYYEWVGYANDPVMTIYPDATTTYTLVGANANGCANRQTLTVFVSPCTGLEQHETVQPDFKIYPNPADKILCIELTEISKLKIYSLSGNILFEGSFKNGKHFFSLEEFNRGVYFLNCTTKYSTKTMKLIVN